MISLFSKVQIWVSEVKNFFCSFWLIFYPLDPDPWIRIFLRIRIQEAKMLRIQRIRILGTDLLYWFRLPLHEAVFRNDIAGLAALLRDAKVQTSNTQVYTTVLTHQIPAVVLYLLGSSVHTGLYNSFGPPDNSCCFYIY